MTIKTLQKANSINNYSLVLINNTKYRAYKISELPKKWYNTEKTTELDAIYNKKAGLVYLID